MSAEPLSAEIVTFQPVTTPASTALTPMAMVSQAVANGASLEMVSKLMDLQERVEKAQGRKAFDIAVADAKGEIPPIVKDKKVGFESVRTGGTTSYSHETLGMIATIVDPILNKHGLSYRYRATQQEGGRISVTCVLSHREGYSEETTLTAGADDSGKKNNIQAIGSTTTYLQRYTLKLALGLATTDRDDDGQSSEEPQISAAADAAINALTQKTTVADLTKWRADNASEIKKLGRDDFTAVRRAYQRHFSSLGGVQ